MDSIILFAENGKRRVMIEQQVLASIPRRKGEDTMPAFVLLGGDKDRLGTPGNITRKTPKFRGGA